MGFSEAHGETPDTISDQGNVRHSCGELHLTPWGGQNRRRAVTLAAEEAEDWSPHALQMGMQNEEQPGTSSKRQRVTLGPRVTRCKLSRIENTFAQTLGCCIGLFSHC